MRTRFQPSDGPDSPAERLAGGGLLVASYPLAGLGLVAGLALVVCAVRVARRRGVGVPRAGVRADTD